MSDQKSIVITGAAKPGIGEAITRSLLEDGAVIVGTYEQEDAATASLMLNEFQDTGRLHLTEIDHSDRVALAKFVAGISDPISGIVFAQFFFAMEDPGAFDHTLWDRSIAVNLTAPNYITHELNPKLADGASIVFITSTEGFIGSFGASAYSATKAAVHNLVKSLANNLGHKNVRVNAIAAGWIGGVMDTDEVFNMSRKITPLARLGTPEEIASVSRFLLSQSSSFVNGTVVTADGGYTGVDTIAKYEFDATQAGGH